MISENLRAFFGHMAAGSRLAGTRVTAQERQRDAKILVESRRRVSVARLVPEGTFGLTSANDVSGQWRLRSVTGLEAIRQRLVKTDNRP
jgi:hypothetical protein